MKTPRLMVGLAVLAFLFSNCKKDKDKPAATPSSNSRCSSSQGDYYLAVWEKGKSGFPDKTSLWNSKEKAAKLLSNNSAAVYAITISGSDVYAAGTDGGTPVYWKNGVIKSLNDGTISGAAIGIVVSGDDVHVVGWQQSSNSKSNSNSGTDSNNKKRAVYWKNGTPTFLPGELTIDNYASGIALVGNDVHIVGFDAAYVSTGYGDYYTTNRAKYWVNGSHVGLAERLGRLVAIAASGSDVYIVGHEQYVKNSKKSSSPISVATLWKNGIAKQLSDTTKVEAAATCVAVCGSNVYVGGWAYDRATKNQVGVYWKDGVRNELTPKTEETEGTVWGIAISGDNCYAVGRTKTKTSATNSLSYSLAKLWKNGKEEAALSIAADTNSGINAIAAQ